MLKRLSILAAVLLLGLCLCGGCKEKKSPTTTEPNTVQVKTEAEYKAQADKEITEKNMDSELDKLEKSVDSDANSQ